MGGSTISLDATATSSAPGSSRRAVEQATQAAIWTRRAEECLPDPGRSFERNQAITATYAALYSKEPSLFKWAGMAAFASHRVGLALRLDGLASSAEIDRALDLLGDTIGEGSPDEQEKLANGLALLRDCNNAVYADIAWAHFAYAQGGLSAVEDVADVDHFHLLVQGFRLIDSGRRLRHPFPHAAREAVWRGNLLLLRHEQQQTVQPFFQRLGAGMEVFTSVVTSVDFGGNEDPALPPSFATWTQGLAYLVGASARAESAQTSFASFMWTTGLPLLLRSRSLPNITDFAQRWLWISSEVMPMWRKIEETDRSLDTFLEALARTPELRRPVP